MFDIDLLEEVFVERIESLGLLNEINNTPTQMPIDSPPSASVWFGAAPPVPGRYETVRDLANAPRRATVHTLIFLPDFYHDNRDTGKRGVVEAIAGAINGWQPPCTGCSVAAVVNPYWDGFEQGGVINYMVQSVIDVFPGNFRRGTKILEEYR